MSHCHLSDGLVAYYNAYRDYLGARERADELIRRIEDHAARGEALFVWNLSADEVEKKADLRRAHEKLESAWRVLQREERDVLFQYPPADVQPKA
jgi:hypothetical protein